MFAGSSEGPPSAQGTTWSNWRPALDSQRLPSGARKEQRPRSRRQTVRLTQDGGTRLRLSPGRFGRAARSARVAGSSLASKASTASTNTSSQPGSPYLLSRSSFARSTQASRRSSPVKENSTLWGAGGSGGVSTGGVDSGGGAEADGVSPAGAAQGAGASPFFARDGDPRNRSRSGGSCTGESVATSASIWRVRFPSAAR